jgi:hypothetical protein
MSRAYRIEWKTASRRITAKDEISIDVALLEILSDEEMKALLDQELLQQGWKKEKGKLVKGFGSARAEIDSERKTVAIVLEREREVTARGQTQAAAHNQAEANAKTAQASLDREVTAELAEGEAKVRENLQGALQKVYVVALEQKARQMGEVESIDRRENEEGELELIIKVKV